ncbi:MAG: hypothetical protein SGI74_06270 [Oligoflexia bacterium]|nr:hypothetical protein [Oligoflexia bacterium]
MKIKIFLFIFFISLTCQGQLPVYKPVNPEFWKEIESSLKDLNYENMIEIAIDQYRATKKDSLENAEAKVAIAMALQKKGFNFAATGIQSEVIKAKIGTEVAALAMSGVEEAVRKFPVDEDSLIGEIVVDIEHALLPPATQDFVNFEQGMFNMLRGFTKWGEENFKKITLDSYWDFKIKYLTALGEVARDRIDSAIERFSGIANNQAAPEDIKSAAGHQWARLIFEKGDHAKAYTLFKNVKLNPREKGLILIERAWAKYYEKDYSKALGLLAALEAPIFDTSRTPEPYILKMIMYKELCYFDSVYEVMKEFKQRFQASMTAINKRKDLRKDQMIINISVLDQRIQKWVNLLNSLKAEYANLNDTGWEDYFFYPIVKKRYEAKIKEVNERLDWILQDKTRETAEQLIDWQEQLNFLDYQTRLDSLRINRGGSELKYSPEEIPHLSFEKIYWTGTGEFWLDELEDYKVFIESRCSQSGDDK